MWLKILVALLCSSAARTALSDEKDAQRKPGDKSASIVGTWKNEVRHAVHWSLYQPVQGARVRDSIVIFKQDGDRLSGYSLTPDHDDEHWNKEGRTEFRSVQFTKPQLVFEFDIDELHHGWRHQTKSKAWIRVEAELKGDRLIGKWGIFEKQSGDELFRGEWEAVRTDASVLGGPFLLIGGRHQDLSKDLRDLFFDLAGGKKAKIVVIPTAVAHADDPKAADEFLNPWRELKPLSVQLLHTRDRKTADDPVFVKPLAEATAVFLTNGHRDRIFNAYRGTLVEKELKKLHARGGLIGGTGSGMCVLDDLMLWHKEPGFEPAHGVFPGFLPDDRDNERLAAAIAANPALVGLEIDAGAAVVIRGPDMRVVGKGTITVHLAKGAKREAKIDTFKPGDRLDVAELRRAAAERAKEEEEKPAPEEVSAFDAAVAGFNNLRIVRDKTRPDSPITEVHFTYSSRRSPLTGRRELVGDAVVRALAALTQLQSLTLEHTDVTDAGMKELAALKHLERLYLKGSRVTDAGVKELAGLKQLKQLYLTRTQITDAGVKELAGLKGLQTLSLSGTDITNAGLKHLAALPQLQALDLGCCRGITDAGLKELAPLRELRSLGLRGNQITDAGLKELTVLTKLETLDLGGATVTAAGLKELAALKQIQSLDLGFCKGLTDAGLKELAKLKQLQTLNLDKIDATAAGLKDLAGLEHLQKLSFYDCRDLTDAHLKELAAFKQLRELILISCFEVSDAGLKELAELKNLEHLAINDLGRVTPAAVAELQKALPRCQIGYPTKRRK